MDRAEYARMVYEDAGREITQSFETQNSNMTLVAGTLAAVLTVLGTGELFHAKSRIGGIPRLSVTSLMVLTIALPLVFRFFVRSTTAYQNLLRFNAIQRAAARFLTGRQPWEAFLLHYTIYVERWRSPRALSRVMLENLRYGYFWVFVAATVPLAWAFYLANWHWGRSVSLALLVVAFGWEASTLPKFRRRYWAVPTEQELSELESSASAPAQGPGEEGEKGRSWLIEERGFFFGRRRLIDREP